MQQQSIWFSDYYIRGIFRPVCTWHTRRHRCRQLLVAVGDVSANSHFRPRASFDTQFSGGAAPDTSGTRKSISVNPWARSGSRRE